MKVIISQSVASKDSAGELKSLTRDLRANLKETARLHREATSLTNKIDKLKDRIKREDSKVASPRRVSPTEITAAPPPSRTGKQVMSRAEMKKTPFDPKAMSGAGWFETVNGESKAPKNIEGYWRPKYNVDFGRLPFPVKMSVAGYDRDSFLKALDKVEKEAYNRPQRGTSEHRWTGRPNGAGEFNLDVWRWPQGYRAYIKAGVPPSAAFYTFITGKTCKGLPTYNR